MVDCERVESYLKESDITPLVNNTNSEVSYIYLAKNSLRFLSFLISSLQLSCFIFIKLSEFYSILSELVIESSGCSIMNEESTAYFSGDELGCCLSLDGITS